MMRSLRMRLLVAILTVIVCFWSMWLCSLAVRVNDQQASWMDEMLRHVATQIVLSMPTTVGQLQKSPTYSIDSLDGIKAEKLSFQVWLGPSRLALHSPGAPAVPMKSDFTDGFAVSDIDGQPWRVYAVSDATGRLQVQVGRSKEQLRGEFTHWVFWSLATAGLVFLLLGVTTWFVLCWSLRGVTRVQQAVSQRQGLELSPLPTRDLPTEVAPLVETFNGMLAQMSSAMEAEKRFISDAAHELRTPLAALMGHAQLALRSPDAAEARAAVERLAEGVQRSARLSEQLLDLARIESTTSHHLQEVALFEPVEWVVRDFETTAAEKRIRIVLQLEPCLVRGNVDALGILVRNLVDNALRYTPHGGRCEVRCETVQRDGRTLVSLSVADNGPGVPPEEHPRIFDRFYRVPGTTARGSGIGLSLVARIARLHDATLELAEGIGGRGLRVVVYFASCDGGDFALSDPMPLETSDTARATAHAATGLAPGSTRPTAPRGAS